MFISKIICHVVIHFNSVYSKSVLQAMQELPGCMRFGVFMAVTLCVVSGYHPFLEWVVEVMCPFEVLVTTRVAGWHCDSRLHVFTYQPLLQKSSNIRCLWQIQETALRVESNVLLCHLLGSILVSIIS